MHKEHEKVDDELAYAVLVQATEGDVRRLSQSKDCCVHLIIVHPIFPSDARNVSERSVVENFKSPGFLNADWPGVATTEQNFTNCSIAHRPREEKPVLMAEPQLFQVHEICSAFRSF